MTEGRKKPIRLEINTTLADSSSNEAVEIRSRNSNKSQSQSSRQDQSGVQLTGIVKLRREVKGRAGKPVSVLYGFEDPNAAKEGALKLLQAKLKEILACGGTFNNETKEIVLQVDDLARVRQALVKMGFSVKG
ncbi:MAG: translation initiation factor [Silvanigrellaceae bacterium]